MADTSFHDLPASTTGYLPTGAHTVTFGYEGAGAQKIDAKSTSDTLCEVLQGWASALCNESRARTMDDAISALHRQHTFNGRPSRYMPEA